MTTEIANVFSELGSGTFQSLLTKAINEVSEKVREYGSHGKQGELNITMKFIPMKDGDQVIVSSKLFKKIPAETGHKTEDFNHTTNFHIDGNGDMVVIVPEENPDGQKNLEV